METELGELLFGVNERYEEDILVETSINTAERGGVKKVLSLEAEGGTLGAELLRGEAEASGRVNFRLLYLDRQDRLCGLDYFKDFKCRIPGERISPDGRCVLNLSVTDAESRVIGDSVDLSAVANVTLAYFGEERTTAVKDASEAEVRKEPFLSGRVAKSERRVELEREESSGPEIKKILLFGAQVIPGEILEKEGDTEVTGELRASMIYLTETDEAVEKTISLPFAERFDGVGVREYELSALNSRVILTGDEENGSVEVEATLVVTELRHEMAEEECVTAICAEKVEVEEQYDEKTERLFKQQRVLSERIVGNIPFEIPDAYVSFVRPGCHAIADLSVEEGAVIAEGVAAFQVIYMTGEGYDSVQSELPFSFRFPLSDAAEGDRAAMTLSIGNARAVPNGKELSLTADVTASVGLYEEKSCRYLVDAKEGEIIPESEAGVSVYFAEKGEDVWKIAKGMKVLPSALLRANPFLADPIEENKKVLIFRNK